MNRYALLIAAPLLFAAPKVAKTARADDTVIRPATASSAPEVFSQGILFPYSIFDRALTGRVDENGNVDYVALKDNADLARFLRAVASADTKQFPVFKVDPTEDELEKDRKAKPTTDRSAELVFWINAYNAYMLKAITDAYPVDVIDQIKDLETAPHRVAGENLTFPQMRDRIASFDKRALFTLTDGTKSGPLLNPTAYRWANINALLVHAVMNCVNDPNNVSVMRSENKVEVGPFLIEMNPYFTDQTIGGGAQRGKMTGVRALLAQYTDKRANQSYLTTNDYVIVPKKVQRRLNMKGIVVGKIQE